jgi:hypothetical protein
MTRYGRNKLAYPYPNSNRHRQATYECLLQLYLSHHLQIQDRSLWLASRVSLLATTHQHR